MDGEDLAMDAIVSLLESRRGAPEAVGSGLLVEVGNRRKVDHVRAMAAEKRRGEVEWPTGPDGQDGEEVNATCTPDPSEGIVLEETIAAMTSCSG
jgi:DNA-directed RNA polymerase specialized sigma24 family protein